MARYYYMTETTCMDPKREKEFNEWYSNVHIPDIAKAGGVIQANRFQLAGPAEGKSKYMTLYEIEYEDFEAWRDAVRKIIGPDPDFIRVDMKTLYQKISSFPK